MNKSCLRHHQQKNPRGSKELHGFFVSLHHKTNQHEETIANQPDCHCTCFGRRRRHFAAGARRFRE